MFLPLLVYLDRVPHTLAKRGLIIDLSASPGRGNAWSQYPGQLFWSSASSFESSVAHNCQARRSGATHSGTTRAICS
jgi:hypothetical protein